MEKGPINGNGEPSAAELELERANLKRQLESKTTLGKTLFSNSIRKRLFELEEVLIPDARRREKLKADLERDRIAQRSKNGKSSPAKPAPRTRLSESIPHAVPISKKSPETVEAPTVTPPRRRVIEVSSPQQETEFEKDLREARATLPPPPAPDPRQAIRDKIAAAKPSPKIHIIPNKNLTAREALETRKKDEEEKVVDWAQVMEQNLEEKESFEPIPVPDVKNMSLEDLKKVGDQLIENFETEIREAKNEFEESRIEERYEEAILAVGFEYTMRGDEWTEEQQEFLNALYEIRQDLKNLIAEEKKDQK